MGEEAQPYPLKMAIRCKNWESLPRAGGIFDQPMTLMEHMSACYGAYSVVQSKNNAKDLTKWAKTHASQWDTYTYLLLIQECETLKEGIEGAEPSFLVKRLFEIQAYIDNLQAKNFHLIRPVILHLLENLPANDLHMRLMCLKLYSTVRDDGNSH